MLPEALLKLRADGSTSPALLSDLKANEALGWRSLVQHYSSLIYTECRTQGLLPQDAADVTQEVFQAAFTLLPRFKQRRRTGSFRRWLRLITRNKIREYRRRERSQPAGQGGTEGYEQLLNATLPRERSSLGAMSVTPSAAVRQALNAIRHDFESRTWQAFWLTAVDGCETSQVAAELEMKPPSVRKAKSRVLARLREELCSIGQKPLSASDVLP